MKAVKVPARRDTSKKWGWGWLLLSITAFLISSYVVWKVVIFVEAINFFNLEEGDVYEISSAREALHSRHPFLRAGAARGLGKIGPSAAAAIPDLLAALKNDTWEVASEAAWSLGKIQSTEPRVIEGLTAALKHEHREVRRYAEYSLKQLGVVQKTKSIYKSKGS